MSNIFSDAIVYSLNTDKQTEYDNILTEHVLLFQLSGEMTFETSEQRIIAQPGQIYLVRKHQFVKATKKPADGQDYNAYLFILKEDVLRQYALEKSIVVPRQLQTQFKNFLLPNNRLFDSLGSSLSFHAREQLKTDHPLSMLKVREMIEILLHTNPKLQDFLFDFSQPHKIDLEKFMLANYKFNVGMEHFATLTGRSLATFKRDFKKIFGDAPGRWLHDTRLKEAHYQIQKNRKKPSSVFLEVGFESFAHFSNAFKAKYGYSPKSAAI